MLLVLGYSIYMIGEEMALMKRSRFLMKRFHSFFGLCLLFFLMEHLFTNSQAALTQNGKGFIRSVEFLHSIPMLGLIEFLTLGLPFVIHIIWGLAYVTQAKLNSRKSKGGTPSLGKFKENKAFTWQRITALLLVIGVLFHVYDMRFNRYPITSDATGEGYVVRLHHERLVQNEPFEVNVIPANTLVGNAKTAFGNDIWEEIIENAPLRPGEVYAKTSSSAEAIFLNLKDTFANPWLSILYTLFVVMATFHAFNGLWTLCVTWGVVTTEKGFKCVRTVTIVLMMIFTFLGLAAIWGT